ncbi:MAG: hypothetical protein HYY02_04170 [Chloroflexi bacterium]|nr:hypothetical protein [Chloroflexota bacterium]
MPAMTDTVREQLARYQSAILAHYPDTRFKLEPTEQEDIWHFSVYTSEKHLQMPRDFMEGLNAIWREHKLSIVTTVYSLAAYREDV